MRPKTIIHYYYSSVELYSISKYLSCQQKSTSDNHYREREVVFDIAFRPVFYYNIGHKADFAQSNTTSKRKKEFTREKKYEKSNSCPDFVWTLKWHRTFDKTGPWTKAGGVNPNDWPQWMRNFKDY